MYRSEDSDPYQNVTDPENCRKGVEGWMDMERGQDRRDKRRGVRGGGRQRNK